MHALFLNQDVVEELCNYADYPALASLARTTSLFFHPATNVIWKSGVDLADLLQTFSPDLVALSETFYDATTTEVVRPPVARQASSDLLVPPSRMLWVSFSPALQLRANRRIELFSCPTTPRLGSIPALFGEDSKSTFSHERANPSFGVLHS